MLVRLSIDKYYKTKVEPTIVGAVKKAFDVHILPHFEKFNCHNWRKERLWKEEIAIVYSRFVDKLELIYNKYTGKYVNPGSSKMSTSLDEFTTMLGNAGLLNEFFGNRECGPLWNLSMMTNKDEINNEKHLNMTFVEFLEAIGRVADRFDMANMEDLFPEYVAKSPYGLDKKLESTFFVLIKYCLSQKHYNQTLKKYTETVETELENLKLGLVTQFA